MRAEKSHVHLGGYPIPSTVWLAMCEVLGIIMRRLGRACGYRTALYCTVLYCTPFKGPRGAIVTLGHIWSFRTSMYVHIYVCMYIDGLPGERCTVPPKQTILEYMYTEWLYNSRPFPLLCGLQPHRHRSRRKNRGSTVIFENGPWLALDTLVVTSLVCSMVREA
jgi:hypothetical protein